MTLVVTVKTYKLANQTQVEASARHTDRMASFAFPSGTLFNISQNNSHNCAGLEDGLLTT